METTNTPRTASESGIVDMFVTIERELETTNQAMRTCEHQINQALRDHTDIMQLAVDLTELRDEFDDLLMQRKSVMTLALRNDYDVSELMRQALQRIETEPKDEYVRLRLLIDKVFDM